MIPSLILLLLYNFVYSSRPKDLGVCIRYQVKIVSSENEIKEGVFEHVTFHPTFKFSGSEFREFIDSVAYGDTLTLYRKIHQLAYPNDYHEGINCIPNLYAIAQEDAVKIPCTEMSEAHLESYEPCDNWTSNDERAGFSFNGMSTINELTKEEIILLQQKPEASYQFWYPDSEDQFYFGYGSYQMLSYNKEIGMKILENMGDQLIREDIKDIRQGAYASYANRKERYQTLKEDLRRKNVILFTIHEAP